MPASKDVPQLAYIISLPRSGSTVLSALLDKRQGVVSPPESAFPQVLGTLSTEERKDRLWMAALYIASTFTPTQLNLAEAAECMDGTNEDILIALGHAVAAKLGRDPAQIRAVVWKSPRIVGMHAGPLSTKGKFIVLRRHPQNVFESQFRVGFGEKNRNPFRFAVFQQSYEHAFSRVPPDRRIDVSYDSLPGVLEQILEFLGVREQGEWLEGESSLKLAAENCYWMREVTGEFKNNDVEKRARLEPTQVSKLEQAMSLARPLRPFLGPVRRYFDRQSLAWVLNRAKELLEAHRQQG
ncbi:sulfotransferase [Luteolibacter arcticus]|uniref:Sulfotransferase n=1 Tax=Luteolibacter arcticus TaxID=1581411 RepID=A0ABT3GJ82_9BACT|nr:sulfotransferase [Luteolibacter arcticus]MCW1923541.1 sulfotransferase [Luteolibacter arcticus]